MSQESDYLWVLDARVRIPDHVVYRRFESETLLLNLDIGQYHGLNRTGGQLVELLKDTQGRVGQAVERLAADTDVSAAEIRRDMAEFCGQLMDRGLIELEDDPRERP